MRNTTASTAVTMDMQMATNFSRSLRITGRPPLRNVEKYVENVEKPVEKVENHECLRLVKGKCGRAARKRSHFDEWPQL